jgi:hypothetical protein
MCPWLRHPLPGLMQLHSSRRVQAVMTSLAMLVLRSTW